MRVELSLRDIEVQCLLAYFDAAIEDYVFWLRDVPVKADPSRESREAYKRDLRLLRKLRRQVAKQIGVD